MNCKDCEKRFTLQLVLVKYIGQDLVRKLITEYADNHVELVDEFDIRPTSLYSATNALELAYHYFDMHANDTLTKLSIDFTYVSWSHGDSFEAVCVFTDNNNNKLFKLTLIHGDYPFENRDAMNDLLNNFASYHNLEIETNDQNIIDEDGLIDIPLYG